MTLILKMLNRILTGTLVVFLAIGCSKRTDNYQESPYSDPEGKAVSKMDVDQYQETEAGDIVSSNVVPKLNITEHEQRIYQNIRRPIVLGYSAGGVSFDTSYLQGLGIMSTPYSNNSKDPYELTYHEKVWVKWGQNKKMGNLVQSIRIMDGYKGAISLAGYNDLHIGDKLEDVVGQDVETYIKKLYQNYFDGAEEDCIKTDHCGINENDDKSGSLVLINDTKGVVYFFLSSEHVVSQIYMKRADLEVNPMAEENIKKPIIFGKGAAGITFDMTYAEAHEILTESKSKQGDESIYSENIWVRWGINEAEGKKAQSIRVMAGYQGALSIPEVGDIFIGADLKTLLPDDQSKIKAINKLYQHFVDSSVADCLGQKICSLQQADSSLVLVVGESGYLFFEKDFSKLKQMIFFTANAESDPELDKVAANNAMPIVFGQGAAGINFDMTYAEASKILSTPTQTDDKGVTYYKENVRITWGKLENEGKKAQAIRVMEGYKGAMNIPGVGSIALGQDLSGLIPNEQAQQNVVRAFYNLLAGAESDCLADEVCSIQEGDMGNGEKYLIVKLGDYGYLFFAAGMKNLFQMIFYTPNPEVDKEAQQKIAEEIEKNKNRPIVLGVGAAGITFETTMAEAHKVLHAVNKTDLFIRYAEDILIHWDDMDNEQSLPDRIIIDKGYKGQLFVPGFPVFSFADELVWLKDETIRKSFISKIFQYVAKGGDTSYDCFSSEECTIETLTDTTVLITAGSALKFYFAGDMSHLIHIEMLRPEHVAEVEHAQELLREQLKVVSNKKQPIIWGTGVAGITFDMSYEQASAILSKPLTTMNGFTYYGEGLGVMWSETEPKIAQLFYVYKGYEGALELPGYGTLKIGDCLVEMFANGETLEKAVNAFYQFISGKANANCLAEQKCAISQLQYSGDYVFDFGRYGGLLLNGQTAVLDGIQMINPNLN